MPKSRKASVALWIVQGLLAALFLFAGGMKLVMPAEMLKGPVPLPELFLRFIGVAEVCGALGLILPGLLRIRQSLTPIAAVGLVTIMSGAATVTIPYPQSEHTSSTLRSSRSNMKSPSQRGNAALGL